MQNSSRSIDKTATTDLVLIGGGHSHAIALRMLGMQPIPAVRLTLISNLVDTPYSGMLPGYIAGFYDYDEAHIDLRPLANFARCRLYIDEAVGLDLANRRVLCRNRPPVAFDYLSIDTGSTPAATTVPGAAEYAIPAKPVPRLLEEWHKILRHVQQAPDQPRVFGIVGGGAGGVELALNLQSCLQRIVQAAGKSPDLIQVHLFQRQPNILPDRGWLMQRLTQGVMRDRNIHLHLGETVTEIQPGRVCCESGLTVDCTHVFWVTTASAPPWIQASGLATDQQGFIAVNDTLQSQSHDFVFAAGDVATMVHHPRPKAGVFAVRQGQPLVNNLRRFALGQSLQSFVPQKQFLILLGTGDRSAIASRGPFALRSRWFWNWKDYIDRKFMRRFSELPTMNAESARPSASPTPFLLGEKRLGDEGSPAVSAMRCAGCGAKVGSSVLQQALDRVHAEQPTPEPAPHVVVGLDHPDDAAILNLPADQLLVQTTDYFRAIVNDPYLFGQIATNHCLSDLFAMGASPDSVLAIAVVPDVQPAKQAETLYQLLSGAFRVLQAAKTSLIGGHTAEGSELAFGLTCNGLIYPDQIMRKSGLQPGQALILTKAIGIGTLFAADMQLQAKGRWIETAIAAMLQSNQQAAQCFQQHQVQVCTDITGFGLLGHLAEMLRSTRTPRNSGHQAGARTRDQYDVNVELWWDMLPILDGARATVQQGIVSSLQPQNQRAMVYLTEAAQASQHPDFPLLFDPQTSGGLLAAVPMALAQDCLAALHQLGYTESCIIGRVFPCEDPTQPIRIRTSPV
ncbi:MAG: selenide, water dikinase SelD [Thainema sp.]